MFLQLFTACISDEDRRIQETLAFAGDNRKELEKVLEHYRDDSLKYEAARFLIMNMPGAYSIDSSVIENCAPFYEVYDSVTRVYGCDTVPYLFWNKRYKEWGSKVDSIWKVYREVYREKLYSRKVLYDLNTLSASRLITEIDLAFEAWRGNVYTRDCSFDDFCEYILPYRRAPGLVIDSARQIFHKRHQGQFFTQPEKDFKKEVVKVLRNYQCLTHSHNYGNGIPIFSAATFEKLKHGLCEHRCWFNSLLLSSLGVMVAVDIVPAWGNRNDSHAWNVVIHNGETHAFEPFWDYDRWKYNRIYNNRTYDKYWGRFRLPKVYRKTYRQYLEGPLTDGGMEIEDIPALFRMVRKKDVSHEYFDTLNVEVRLQNIPTGERYAYLCVFNNYKWAPVQWGRITEGRVVFVGMGKDILYMPMYCKDGEMEVADQAFWLKPDGSKIFLKPGEERREIVVHNFTGDTSYHGNHKNNDYVSGIVLTGGKNRNILRDTICMFPEEMELWTVTVSPAMTDSLRYVRMHLPKDRLAMGRLEFYKQTPGGIKRLDNSRFLQQLPISDWGESPAYIFDSWSSTGYNQVIPQGYVDIDLGECCRLSQIRFCPYLNGGFREDAEYELYYWDAQWHSIAKQRGGNTLHFRDVPDGALLMICKLNSNSAVSRPFIFADGEIRWL